jgi:hypothetical protein
VSVFDKRLVFVCMCLTAAFMVFAAGCVLVADYWAPMLGLAVAAGLAAVVSGLWLLAGRLFPDRSTERDGKAWTDGDESLLLAGTYEPIHGETPTGGS